MSEIQTNTEHQILQAAEDLFLQKGFTNTSTTEIAKLAGCNQALVHYYYRTKENLFKQIFIKKIELFLKTFLLPDDNKNFLERLEIRIELYFDMLNENRNLPFLLLNELILNEDRRNFIRENFLMNEYRQQIYYQFDKNLKQEIKNGNIREIESLDLLLNIVSMTIFTFLTLPIYSDLLEKDEKEKDLYIERRKKEVINMVVKGLKP